MFRTRFQYLVSIQYLGFRYAGWQKQPKQKTIAGMLDKTLRFIWPETTFKVVGANRTDARVSSLAGAFLLITDNFEIPDFPDFIGDMNRNLPADIRITAIEKAPEDFNIIQDVAVKEYRYLFSFQEKQHPFCAPIMANFPYPLNVKAMQDAACVFVGTHDFSAFTVRDAVHKDCTRTVLEAEIVPNTEYSASYFPKESFLFRVRGKGFLRYQIRMMLGALVLLGKGELSQDELEIMLGNGKAGEQHFIAPGSGLFLAEMEFDL